MSCRAAAARFGVSAASAISWRQLVVQHGTPAAKPQGGDVVRQDRCARSLHPGCDRGEGRHHAGRVASAARRVGIGTLWRFFRPASDHAQKRDRARHEQGPPRNREAPGRVVRWAARSRSRTPGLHRRDMGVHQHGRVATVAVGAASGCARACPTDNGRPPPSSPACAAPAWWRRWCSTARSNGMRSLPISPVLVPASHPATLSSWTNLSSHKAPAARDASKRRAPSCSFLPPDSPDFNPIEQAFSKLKAHLRKAAETHYPRPVGRHRPHPRPVLATGVCQLLRQRRIRCRLIGIRSSFRR